MKFFIIFTTRFARDAEFTEMLNLFDLPAFMSRLDGGDAPKAGCKQRQIKTIMPSAAWAIYARRAE